MEKNSIEHELREALKESSNDLAKVKGEKQRFINDIKSGLGSQIKENPNRVIIVKQPWHVKLGLMIKKIFTKF